MYYDLYSALDYPSDIIWVLGVYRVRIDYCSYNATIDFARKYVFNILANTLSDKVLGALMYSSVSSLMYIS